MNFLWMNGDKCIKIEPVISFIQNILTVIQWIVPIILILIGISKFLKERNNKKKVKRTNKKILNMLIVALIVFVLLWGIKVFIHEATKEQIEEEKWIMC